MKIKSDVQLMGLRPEMIIAMMIAEPILERHGQEIVITSGTDSKHSKNSRHYIGCGIDLRSRDIDPDNIDACEAELKEALGKEFYCAFERDHFHIQFNGTTPS